MTLKPSRRPWARRLVPPRKVTATPPQEGYHRLNPPFGVPLDSRPAGRWLSNTCVLKRIGLLDCSSVYCLEMSRGQNFEC